MKYLTEERAKNLEESIGFLSSLKENNIVVGESLQNFNSKKTNALRELVQINIRRQELLNIICGN